MRNAKLQDSVRNAKQEDSEEREADKEREHALAMRRLEIEAQREAQRTQDSNNLSQPVAGSIQLESFKMTHLLQPYKLGRTLGSICSISKECVTCTISHSPLGPTVFLHCYLVRQLR